MSRVLILTYVMPANALHLAASMQNRYLSFTIAEAGYCCLHVN